MTFKEQYNDTLERYEQFWQRTNQDRPILNFTAPKADAEPIPQPRDLHQQWLDEEFLAAKYHCMLERTEYLAEAVPMMFTNLGPGCFSACIGGNYDLAKNTVWLDRRPVIEDWEDLPPIEFDENSEMWQHVLRLQNRYAADPSIHYSITDLGGIMDIVASLRGTQELLYDLYDYPDEIKALSKRITQMWKRAYDLQLEMVKKVDQPYNNWMNIPSAKPWYPLQCDFCYMISPAHFDEFVMPDLVEQANYVERPVYHLDGAGELPHLDRILELPNLAAIQWVPGAGQPPIWDERWFPIYRKIQDKNIGLIFLGGVSEKDVAGAERLLKTLDPRGVYISGKFSSKKKADEMLENIIRWSK